MIPNNEQKKAIKLPIDLQCDEADAFLNNIRKYLDLMSVKDMKIEDYEFEDNETLLYVSFIQDIQIKDDDLGQLSGIFVSHPGSVKLRFKEDGSLKDYEISKPNEKTQFSIKNEVKRLIQQDSIYVAKPDEKIFPEKLKWGQDFAIISDKNGNRRLERIRF